MKYRELLILYKEDKLDKESREQVEADIEQHEAISGYLLEQEEQAGIEAFGAKWEESSIFLQDKEKQYMDKINPDFNHIVNHAIRMVFLKMGACITVVTLAVVLFVIFLLPEVVDCFYYNPGKSTGEHGNQSSLDFAVYTELCIPGNNRDNVSVKERGYGNYDIIISQDISYNDSFTNLAGKIEKGTLELYNIDALKRPVQNAFTWFQMEGSSSDSLTNLISKEKKTNYCAAGDVNSATEKLHKLDENTKYTAYVTLDKMMHYEKFMKYLNKVNKKISIGNVWCAVCTENGEKTSGLERFRAENLGFNCELTSSHNLDWDRETYPYLLLWDRTSDEAGFTDELNKNMQKEDFMKVHFTSMLKYMADQDKFLAMMGEQPQNYLNAAAYVEKNGLVVYGFACIADKESILKLQQENAVYEIYTQKL